jgi:hypothetical protein
MARVYNDNTETYQEEFRGEMIIIKPKGYVEMPWAKANAFRGAFTPMVRDGMGRDLKPKMIRIIADPGERIKDQSSKGVQGFICMRDGAMFNSKSELDAYTKAHFGGEQIVDEAVEERTTSKKKGK